ncbi:MAG: GDP-mannose 4,6-dehydratase [Methanoculleus sp.]|nr:NAD-dependent epimerase/dehydratase family protein [Methanomicrobiales archaeon]
MNWTETKVLVTGAGGFIGSHLTEHLTGLGADVCAFVRYNSRNDPGLLRLLPKESQEQVRFVMGDLKDADAVRSAVRDVEIVFHLGSLIAIPYSYIHPRETVETNVLGALNIFEAARDAGVGKVVHTSTSEVYGTARYIPIDENHPLQGQSPYSASKIGADKLAESFYRSFDVPIATIRPFNTYGPRQSARAVIPTIIAQALTQERVVLGATHTTRDYTFVGDLVRAFVLVAESPRTAGETVNVGSNSEISIGTVAEMVASLVGKEIEVVTDSDRLRPEKSEVERLWCDNTRARDLLGWSPAVPLKEGLLQTIAWFREHLDLYSPGQYVT